MVERQQKFQKRGKIQNGGRLKRPPASEKPLQGRRPKFESYLRNSLSVSVIVVTGAQTPLRRRTSVWRAPRANSMARHSSEKESSF